MVAVNGIPPASVRETPPPFLDVDPPHWAARGLAYLLILLCITGAIIATVLQLPETVSSSFILMPLQDTDPIRAAQAGTIVEVRVAEGQAVPQSETLLVLYSQAVSERSAALRTLETQQQGAEAGLRNHRDTYTSQRRADEEERRRLEGHLTLLRQKLEQHRLIHTTMQQHYRVSRDILERESASVASEKLFKRNHLTLLQERASRDAQLYHRGLMSREDYASRQLEVTKAALDLEQGQRQLDVVQLKIQQQQTTYANQEAERQLLITQIEAEQREVHTALEKLHHTMAARQAEYREQVRRLEEDREKATIRITALQKDLRHSSDNALAILAPCTGTVLRLHIKAAGAVVQAGDMLGEFICEPASLQAELRVPPSGIGLIKPGQRVKLLYDAFPYQRYGVRHGTVRWISPASTVVQDHPVFRVLVDIADTAIRIQDDSVPLLAGMGGQAQVVVEKRSLVSYAFAPLHRLQETFTMVPEAAPVPAPKTSLPR
jgi:hemolysin D